MKNYFLLRNSSDPKIIGVKNGVMQAEINKNGFKNVEKYEELMVNLGGFDSWFKAKKYYNPDMELECVTLLEGAKLTSFLSFGPALMECPFLISEGAYLVFKKFNIQKHFLYKANVEFGEKFYPYFLFYCNSLDKDFIDYEKTIFFTGSKILGKDFLNFSSRQEEDQYKKTVGLHCRVEKIAFFSRFVEDLDFIITPYNNIFVSEGLKNSLENEGVDGVNFFPAFGEGRDWPILLMS